MRSRASSPGKRLHHNPPGCSRQKPWSHSSCSDCSPHFVRNQSSQPARLKVLTWSLKVMCALAPPSPPSLFLDHSVPLAYPSSKPLRGQLRLPLPRMSSKVFSSPDPSQTSGLSSRVSTSSGRLRGSPSNMASFLPHYGLFPV